MKIQLEQLDLAQPWPTFIMRPGYDAVSILLRMGTIPIGDVLVRPVRKRLVTPERVRRRIARQYARTILENLVREALIAGPAALRALPGGTFPHLQAGTTTSRELCAYVAEHILLADGMPQPFRSWVEESQDRRSWPMPPVTVAVCTRDRPEQLEECLVRIQQLDYPDFDILIVDNSHDPIPAREIADKLGVEYVRSMVPGLSRARNVAIEHSRRKWIAFTDDDCRVEPNWLAELVRPTQDTNCRCVCGLVVPTQLENSAQITFETYRGLGRGCAGRSFGPAFLNASSLTSPPTWDIGTGANMLVLKAFAQSIGGFDAELGPGPHSVGGCGAEADFFYQVLRHGHNIHYAARAVVHHQHLSSPQALRRQIYSYAVGHAAYHARCLLKYRDYRSLLHLAWHLPAGVAADFIRAMSGRTKRPLPLMALEARGTLVGPFHYAAVKAKALWKRWFDHSRPLRRRSISPAPRPACAPSPTFAEPLAEAASYKPHRANQSFRAA